MLSQQALQEFKDAWRQEYGEEISDDFAVEQAISLLTLMDTIYQPIKCDWFAEIQNEKE